MIENETVTLNQLLSSEKELSAKKLMKAESCDNLAYLKKLLTKEVKIFWPVVCSFILKKLVEILDQKVSDVMIAAWNKYKDIVQYTDAEKYPPDETYLVPLVEHTIESVYEPSLEILFNNQPVGELNFEITFFITLEGIALEIKGGKIMKVNTGSCKGGGSIKCEDITIFEKETSPFNLPGSIDLGKGIPIPKLPV
jgi:hypothetical protein